MNTEAQLWDSLKRAADRAKVMAARFEVITHVGVSDVEYVAGRWMGWIELKVTRTKNPDAPLRFGHELTSDQCSWLLAHHAPGYQRRSWLLCGLSAEPTWAGFVLVPAPATVRFLRDDKPTLNEMESRGWVWHGMDEVVEALRREHST